MPKSIAKKRNKIYYYRNPPKEGEIETKITWKIDQYHCYGGADTTDKTTK